MNHSVPAFVAALALASCGTSPGQVTLKEGVRGCATLRDAAQFEKIEQARDWAASMEMLRSGRCSFVAPGETIVIEKAALDGSTQFHERGRDRSLWTRESIKTVGRGA